jgi:hypothetical protein
MNDGLATAARRRTGSAGSPVPGKANAADLARTRRGLWQLQVFEHDKDAEWRRDTDTPRTSTAAEALIRSLPFISLPIRRASFLKKM